MNAPALDQPLFWIQVAGKPFPYPVMAANEWNVYVRVPGQPNLAILPNVQRGKTWDALKVTL